MFLEIERFDDLQKKWTDLFENMYTKPSQYMQFEFQKIYKQFLWVGKQRIGMKYIVYVAYQDGVPKCIVPLIYHPKKKNYYIAGDLCKTGCLDFIYDNSLTVDEMSEILVLLKSKIKTGTLVINKMPSNSLVLQSILKEKPDIQIRDSSCVRISFEDSYDDYYGQLSKSVRQNIRTAHNRLAREEKSESVCVYFGKRQERKKEILKLYRKRAGEKNGTSQNLLSGIISDFFNPITRAVKILDNSFTSVYSIDNHIAGVMEGFISKDGRSVIIPRLAINSEYGVYSPGTLLISETIKYLIDHTIVRELDLSRGDEKYKFAMRGLPYSIVSFHYSFS